MNCGLETDVKAEDLSRTFNAHSQFGILFDTFSKEIGFPLQTYPLHPFKWIPHFIVTLALEDDKKLIRAELM
jgi:hypothetical protein